MPTRAELLAEAKKRGHKGFSTKKKSELEEMLKKPPPKPPRGVPRGIEKSKKAGFVRMEIAKGNLKKEGGRIVKAGGGTKPAPVQGPRNLQKGFGIKRMPIKRLLPMVGDGGEDQDFTIDVEEEKNDPNIGKYEVIKYKPKAKVVAHLKKLLSKTDDEDEKKNIQEQLTFAEKRYNPPKRDIRVLPMGKTYSDAELKEEREKWKKLPKLKFKGYAQGPSGEVNTLRKSGIRLYRTESDWLNGISEGSKSGNGYDIGGGKYKPSKMTGFDFEKK